MSIEGKFKKKSLMTTCVKLPGRCKFLKAIPENVSFFHQLFSHEGGSVEPQYKKKKSSQREREFRENLDVRVFFLSGFLFVFQPKRTRNDVQASNSEIKEIFMISFWKSLRM